MDNVILIDGIKPRSYKTEKDYIAYTLPFLDLIGYKKISIVEIEKVYPYGIDVSIQKENSYGN